MESSGIADAIRKEEGNEKYDYLLVMKDLETVLLIDQWKDQKALDAHHASPMMKQLAQLRDKYDTDFKYNYEGLEVHHIIPLEEDYSRRLDSYNLITLCNMHPPAKTE